MENALATLSSMIVMNHWNDIPKIDGIQLDRPGQGFAAEEVTDNKLWYHDIKCFLQRQDYPLGASDKDKKTLRILAGNFFFNEDILYNIHFDMVLLRCVDRHEEDLLMRKVHE